MSAAPASTQPGRLTTRLKRAFTKEWFTGHAFEIAVLATLGLLAELTFYIARNDGVSPQTIWAAVAATLLGAAVGAAELVSRYKDSPETAIGGFPGGLYMALNASASLLAFVVIRELNWRFGVGAAEGDSTTLRMMQVLVAGLGSAALFRTSLFNIKAGDEEIGVGPSALMTTALAATERAVDRRQALWREPRVHSIMKNVDFLKAATQLVPYCLEVALQNVTPEEAERVADLVSKLEAKKWADSVKSMILGGSLMSIVGYDVLFYAVEDLCPDIRRDVNQPCVPPPS